MTYEPDFSSNEIGIHFEYFDGWRYELNAAKMADYPDDDAVALSF